MLKALIYSSILIFQLESKPNLETTTCDQLNAEATVTHSSSGQDNGAAEVRVTGAAGTVKYFFCEEDGKVLNEEQINSNKIERLKKGTYFCVVAAARCTKKIMIIID
jgi:hypothetical protein